MPLFQTSVLKKYLSQQDTAKITTAYTEYAAYFHHSAIQENIRNSKEEQFQEGFLRELFVTILGYTLNPAPHFNLTTEYKNVKDSKKADGAILIPMGDDPLKNKVIGVIELKGTNTTDLGKIEAQAFGYKNNQPECVYVITSNFEKLRFYIDNAIEYLEFNLFQLSKAEFELLYLCLAYDNIKNNVAKSIKDQSVSEEDTITKKLYKDYSLFKRELFQNLVQLNPQYDPLELFQKSQKLLDRFLFIFFAEDRNLLPTNLIFRINKEWQQLQQMRIQVSLYDRYKIYFNDLNTGAKVQLPAFSQTNTIDKEEHHIFAYNGGLFKPDDLLNNLNIGDAILFEHTEKLSNYDFASEVDVNILGHIFENSLNELDEVKAQLEGAEIDKTKTKRKKDGVFYTPKYITKYIVENTVGKLCEEKRPLAPEGGILSKLPKKQKEQLLKDIQEYRNWLLQLTICDPACGSGAFLNQALDFLIAEHQYIDELQAKLFGDAMVLSDIATSILEHNLFGVDLNEESVEIAKLSLWLRTAQPNRKLNDLNSNIKCGNSLIDDPAIAGNKAFNWQQAFPKVFQEKNKKAYHITTALHDSRTSQRMIDYKVREKRDMGTNPYPNVQYLTSQEEHIIVKEIHDIVKADNLKIVEFNVCRDHIHILLVCEENELSKIVQKIKAKTARTVNIHRGITIINKPSTATTREQAPSTRDEVATREAAPTSRDEDTTIVGTREPAPLSEVNETIENGKKRGEKQNSLWTQKFGSSEINTAEYLHNTIAYIKRNREKHELPPHDKQTQYYLENMLCTLEEAFETEYKGGFDVVIGNPPYVQLQSMGSISDDLQKMKYTTFEKTSDLYCLFHELGNIILKENGLLGFITSNKWLRANYGKSLRNYLLENTQPLELIDLGSGIFDSATVDSNILIFEKTKSNKKSFIGLDISKEKIFTDFTVFETRKVEISPKANDIWSISNVLETKIKTKIEAIGTPLKDWNIKINYGIKTGFNDAFIIDEKTKKELLIKDSKNYEIIHPILRGRDINRYNTDYQNLYLINVHNGYGAIPEIKIENYPTIKEHLDKFYTQLEKRGDKGKTPYNLRNCVYVDDFFSENLFYPDICQRLSFTKVNSMFSNNTGYYLKTNDSFLLSILNSNLINYYYKKISAQLGETGVRSFTIYIENIPIPKITDLEKQPFIEKADLMLSLNKDLQEISQKFQRMLQRKFFSSVPTMEPAPLPNPAPLPSPAVTSMEQAPLPNTAALPSPAVTTMEQAPLPNPAPLPKKLQEWYMLSYSQFIIELTKKKVKLSLSEEAEWEDYFMQESKKALDLKTQIDATDKAIDAMVYELYGLSEEEVLIVENS